MKLKYKFGKVISGILISLIFFWSCDYSYLEIEQLPDYTYSPVVALPLIHSRLTIDDLITDEDTTAVNVDEDGLVVLVYNDQIFSTFSDGLLELPDQQFEKSFTIEEYPKTQKIMFPEEFTFGVSGEERLDSVVFKQGSMHFSVEAAELFADGFDVEVGVLFPDLTDQYGNPLSFTIINDNPEDVSLQGYSLEFISDSANPNKVRVEYDINVSGEGNPENAPYQVKVNHNLMSMSFEKIFGFLGQETYMLGQGRIALDVFSQLSEGNITFAEPVIKLVARNSFGLPIGLNFNELYVNSTDQMHHIIGFPNPFHIDNPGLDQVGTSVSSENAITAENSNIVQVMASLPEELVYDLEAIINPNNETDNFILDESELSVDLEIELPLHGLFNHATVTDTLGLELDYDLQEVQWLELSIDINNGFPIEALLQVHFLDHNNNLLFKLFEDVDYENIIDPAPVDAQGVVTEPMRRNTRVMFDRSMIEQLLQARHVVLSSRFSTSGNGGENVKIMDHYALEVNLGIRGQAETEVVF